jgi:hypothetical protein
MIDEQQ